MASNEKAAKDWRDAHPLMHEEAGCENCAHPFRFDFDACPMRKGALFDYQGRCQANPYGTRC
jgi:hypothetical protein